MRPQAMSIEAVISQTLDYAVIEGWDAGKQAELAARVVRRMRPDWSDLEARSAVDWVRSRAGQEFRAI